MPTTTNDATYEFLATLRRATGEVFIKEVSGKVYLPETVYERPRIEILPSGNLSWELGGQDIGMFELEGRCNYKGRVVEIRAPGSYLGEGHHRFSLSERLDTSYREVRTGRLEIISTLSSPHDSSEIEFDLTDSIILSPMVMQTLHEDGAVTTERGELFQFPLTPAVTLEFDYKYKLMKSKGSQLNCSRKLVAKGRLQTSDQELDPSALLTHLDNFLLLVSLIENHRCACVSAYWRQGTTVTSLYRLDRAIPDRDPNHSVSDLLLENSFKDFLESGTATLAKSQQSDLIWTALAGMTSFQKGATIAYDYLRVFAAFETLVLAYRRENSLDFVLSDSAERKRFSKDLRRFIKTHETLEGSPDRRRMLYGAVNGFGRISLQDAAERLFTDTDVATDDLWPVFDTSGGCSLKNIRDRLVHGDHFSMEEEFRGIAPAQRSLRILVLRMLLNALGWNENCSRVGWEGRPRGDWRAAREYLSS